MNLQFSPRASRYMLSASLFLLAFAGSVRAQELARTDFMRTPRQNTTLYKVSLMSLIAANAADTVSSLSSGGRELNPLLAGSNKKFLAVKSGMVGGTVLLEWFLVRNHPERQRFFTWVNFGASAGLAGVAWHNMNIGR